MTGRRYDIEQTGDITHKKKQETNLWECTLDFMDIFSILKRNDKNDQDHLSGKTVRRYAL